MFNRPSSTNNKDILQKLAIRFMKHVIDANWKEIEDMLSISPLLMFESVSTDDDIRMPRGSIQTGLSYACIMRDRYTLDLCKKSLINLPDEYQVAYKKAVTTFETEGEIPTRDEIIDGYDYEQFQDLVERWLLNDHAEFPVTTKDIQNYLI